MGIDSSDMPRQRTFSNQDVVEFMRAHEEPFVTVGDVAEEIGIRTSTAHKRLVEMCELGLIDRKKVGASAVVWWLPERCS